MKSAIRFALVVVGLSLNISCHSSKRENGGGNAGPQKPKIARAIDVKSVNAGFAALYDDGSVKTWGTLNPIPHDVLKQLEKGVVSLHSAGTIFAALKSDGKVVTWGSTSTLMKSEVPAELRTGVKKIVSNDDAFAAIKEDGSVFSWGGSSSNFGSDSSKVSEELKSGVVDVFAGAWKFAALKFSGDLVPWGDCHYCDIYNYDRAVSKNAVQFIGNLSAMAVIKADGSVATWGHVEAGGDSSAVESRLHSDVVKVIPISGVISAKEQAFAALKKDGSVVSWGSLACESPETRSGVKDIYPLGFNFRYAFLKEDGTAGACGGNKVESSVKSILTFKYRDGFFVVKTTGELVGYGLKTPENVGGPVKDVVLSATGEWVALRDDGGIRILYQPKGSDIENLLNSGVIKVIASYDAFVALKSDGSITAWGNPNSGGVIPK